MAVKWNSGLLGEKGPLTIWVKGANYQAKKASYSKGTNN